mmetsp:Transcript_23330/g.55574  ORF Transcript_23330/g.55574 Transcript_23330/m.55574 type:complete len:329 (-) Transcript_23330:473-1459(-)
MHPLRHALLRQQRCHHPLLARIQRLPHSLHRLPQTVCRARASVRSLLPSVGLLVLFPDHEGCAELWLCHPDAAHQPVGDTQQRELMLGRAPVQFSFLLHDADIPVASGVGLSIEGSERAVKHSLPGDSLDGHVHCEVQRGLVHEGAVRRRLMRERPRNVKCISFPQKQNALTSLVQGHVHSPPCAVPCAAEGPSLLSHSWGTWGCCGGGWSSSHEPHLLPIQLQDETVFSFPVPGWSCMSSRRGPVQIGVDWQVKFLLETVRDGGNHCMSLVCVVQNDREIVFKQFRCLLRLYSLSWRPKKFAGVPEAADERNVMKILQLTAGQDMLV